MGNPASLAEERLCRVRGLHAQGELPAGPQPSV